MVASNGKFPLPYELTQLPPSLVCSLSSRRTWDGENGNGKRIYREAQMVKYLREYRFYIVLFSFILIPVIAIDTTTRAPRDYMFYDKAIVTITSPVQSVITWSLDQLTSGFNNYLYLWHARRQRAAHG